MALTSDISFPLPFPSLRTISGDGSAPYIVGAIFTDSYADKAARLASSCMKFSLPFELHEVPTVHRSMSIKGGDDLRFSKPNFIHHLLSMHKRPVLYLDADCELVAEPRLITELTRDGYDFAIYNWFADEYTDRFYPVDDQRRYFRYTGGVDEYSTTQLIGAGCTQFYRNSVAARAFLRRWHRTVAEFAGCADDDCLDFTYNNLRKRDWLSWVLRTRWLPKAYARYMFWIYVEPIINHADILSPSSKFPRIRDPRGRKRFYPSMTEKRNVTLLLPRECIIDTEERMLCNLVDGKLVPIEKTPQQFWV
jgi:hypothetical protein